MKLKISHLLLIFSTGFLHSSSTLLELLIMQFAHLQALRNITTMH